MAILLVAACQAVRTAWADRLYRGGDVEAAARLRPDRAEYYVADPERALRHNPFLTTARMQLAARLEMQGASDAAEAALLVGAERDRQYAPAWALANFYYRAGRADRFWPWARAAAQVSPGGLAPLFDLSFAMQDNAAAVWQRVAMSRPMVEREYLSYLLERGRLEAARDAALRIGARAAAEDREPLLRYVDGALAGGQTESAAAVWNRLCARRLVPYAPRAAGELVNGDFRRPSLDRGFDWRAGTAGCAVAARSASDGPAMEWFLSPHRPERCELYAQALHVADGARYVLRFEYRTRDMRDPTGVRWTLGNGLESEIRAAEGWTGAAWHWQASEGTRRLALAWRRAPGSTRGEGGILLRRVRLEPDSEISQKE